jgi:hypothetical protein
MVRAAVSVPQMATHTPNIATVQCITTRVTVVDVVQFIPSFLPGLRWEMIVAGGSGYANDPLLGNIFEIYRKNPLHRINLRKSLKLTVKTTPLSVTCITLYPEKYFDPEGSMVFEGCSFSFLQTFLLGSGQDRPTDFLRKLIVRVRKKIFVPALAVSRDVYLVCYTGADPVQL